MLTNWIAIILITMSTLLGAAAAASPAWAGLLTYEFTVRAAFGPLDGVVSSGSFSFDEALVPPSGFGEVVGFPILSRLSFIWNGIAYDESTANAGSLAFSTFAPDQVLEGFSIGNHCSGDGGVGPGTCLVIGHTNDWHAATGSGFAYALPDIPFVFGQGSVTFARVEVPPVPECSTLALLGSGLALVISVGSRRRRGT